MPYKNIHFAKLEKRLLNDPRFYMMSERSQLNYLRFIMLACEMYNKVTKNIEALRLAFKTHQKASEILESIEEIKANFPKFKSNKNFYYFKEFETKTNWVKKELPRNSQGTPKEVIDIEKRREEKEEYKEEEKNDYFESFWNEYPKKTGKKYALSCWKKVSPSNSLFEKIIQAVKLQKTWPQWNKDDGQYIPNPATWLNQGRWDDVYEDRRCKKCNDRGKFITKTGYEVICECPAGKGKN
jgi:hypothetical protein